MNTIRIASLAAIVGVAAFSQSTPVTMEQGAPLNPVTVINVFTGSNLIYQCRTKSTQRAFDYVAASKFTNVVVAANVGTVTTSANHGLQVGNTITLTGSATAALNGAYIIQTVPSATTFTITTSGVSNGTYTDLTALTTTAARSNANIWSIEKFTYDGSGNTTAAQWANGNTGQSNSCDARATLAFN